MPALFVCLFYNAFYFVVWGKYFIPQPNVLFLKCNMNFKKSFDLSKYL